MAFLKKNSQKPVKISIKSWNLCGRLVSENKVYSNHDLQRYVISQWGV